MNILAIPYPSTSTEELTHFTFAPHVEQVKLDVESDEEIGVWFDGDEVVLESLSVGKVVCEGCLACMLVSCCYYPVMR